MRDMAGKIAELKFEAPLARFEEEDTASLKNMNLLTGAKRVPYLLRCAPEAISFACLVVKSFVSARGHVRPPKFAKLATHELI